MISATAEKYFYNFVSFYCKNTVLAPLKYAIIRGAFFCVKKNGQKQPKNTETDGLQMEEMILASASPRRKELLASMGISFTVVVADATEATEGSPDEVVMENARRKAMAVAQLHPGRMVLGSDTVVCVEGHVLGKPKDKEDAFRMLRSLSGREHQVYTGVCLIKDGKNDVRCDKTDVYFASLTDDEIQAYILTGEPMDKAGAYAIQGIAGMYVEKINGSFSNVIGLPTSLVRQMLRDFQ